VATLTAGDFLFTFAPLASPEWKRLSIIGECLLPAAWLAFSANIGEEKTKQGFRPTYLIGLGATGIALYSVFQPIQILVYSKYEGGLLYVTTNGYYLYLFCVLVALLALVRLEGVLWFSRGGTRWSIKYAVLGVGGLLGMFIFYYSYPILGRVVDTRLITARNSVFLVSALLLTGAALRQGFLGSNVFVSRRIVFPSTALLAVGLYFIVLGLIGEGLHRFDAEVARTLIIVFVFIGIIGFLVLLLSEKFRRRAKRFITDNFYRHRYEYKDEWLKFTKQLSTVDTLDDVIKVTLDIMAETFGVSHVCYWEYMQAGGSLRHRGCNQRWRFEPGLIHIGTQTAYLNEEDSFVRSANDESLGPDAKALLEKTRGDVLIPLAGTTGFLGILVLGKNVAGFTYDEEDDELMKTLAGQASYAIEKTKLSVALAESRELEAMGKVTSFVLHDLKNMTTSLSMLLANAEEHLDQPEFQKDMVHTIQNTVNRMSSVMRKLSDLKEEQALTLAPVELVPLAKSVIADMAVPRRIRVVFENESSAPVVLGDAPQITRVIVNLLMNAVQAIHDSGAIKVVFSSEKNLGCVKISDTGCGMPEQFIRDALFRPFKTSKTGGLGIGLYQCQSIVKAHKGRLEVSSSEGVGSEFSLSLPMASPL